MPLGRLPTCIHALQADAASAAQGQGEDEDEEEGEFDDDDDDEWSPQQLLELLQEPLEGEEEVGGCVCNAVISG
jgi:hypothetical protein